MIADGRLAYNIIYPLLNHKRIRNALHSQPEDK